MNSRQRGVVWLLVALGLGRFLDALDLPFERRSQGGPSAAASSAAQGESATGSAGHLRVDSLGARPNVPSAQSASGVDTSNGGGNHIESRAAKLPESSGPISINRANATELQRLPGVGPVLAARIVAERDAHGPFHAVADLRRVKGIGVKTSARLASHLRFD